jgi:hypothetical protein
MAPQGAIAFLKVIQVWIANDFKRRLRYSSKYAGLHAVGTVLVAICAAWLVFGVWYPTPYQYASGGAQLFLLIIGIDVICGPLLTLILLSPSKSRLSLMSDIALIVLIQLMALAYGLWSVWQARPLFLVHEFDRFKVISRVDLLEQDTSKIPAQLLPRLFSPPLVIGIRKPTDQERKEVLFESAFGGRDYAQRPEFYIPYTDEVAQLALVNAKPVTEFIMQNIDSASKIHEMATVHQDYVDRMKFLPVMARRDWIAVLNSKGYLIGFVEGDGFSVQQPK